MGEFFLAVTFSLSHAGLEVYTTTTEKKDLISLSSDASDVSTNFKLQNGEITQIDYIGELYSDNFEQDYTDISSNASIVLPMDYYSSIFKGRKVALKKGGNNWEDMSTAIQGFVTEISYSKDKIDVKINGLDKLLEQNKKFSFKKTKRSKIIKKIIESSGLKAKVNVSGLKDDVTDFNNNSSSGSSKKTSSASSGLKGGEGKTVDELVAKIVGSETDELKKAKLVHQWLKENVRYHYHECTWYHTPEACLKHKHQLNCADTALLTRAMMASAGLKCYVVHRSHANGHFWTLIEIGGKIYASDQTGSGSDWNTIWYADGDRRACNSRGGNWDSKNGKKPDC